MGTETLKTCKQGPCVMQEFRHVKPLNDARDAGEAAALEWSRDIVCRIPRNYDAA
jgi:hypothetical protein